MKLFFSRLGIGFALVFWCSSALMNGTFGASLGKGTIDAVALAGLSVAADGFKAILPFLALWAFQKQRYIAAIAASVFFVVCCIYSFVSAVGFAAQNRIESAGSKEHDMLVYQQLKRQLGDKRRQRDTLGTPRPSATIKAEQDSLLATVINLGKGKRRSIGDLTDNCAKAEKYGQKTCPKVLALNQELATAERAEQLSDDISALTAKITKKGASGASKTADAQSAVLARIFGLKLESVQTALVIVVVILSEMGSSFGFFVSLSHRLKAPTSDTPQRSLKGFLGRVMNRASTATSSVAPSSEILVETWSRERVKKKRGAAVKASDLHQDCIAWCAAKGWEAPNISVFGRSLKALGFKSKRQGGFVRYQGVVFA